MARPNAPFKTGGCLDLMLGTDRQLKPTAANRRQATYGY